MGSDGQRGFPAHCGEGNRGIGANPPGVLRLAAAGILPPDPEAVAGALPQVRALGLLGASWQLPDVERLTPELARAIARRMDDAGVALAQLLPPQYPSLVDPDPARRTAGLECLNRCGELARTLGADSLYVRPGSLNPRGPWLPHPGNHRPEVRSRLAESLTAAARRAADQGVVLALEGHVLSPVDSPEVARELLQQVDSPALRFNLDLVNFLGSVDDAYAPHAMQTRLLARVGGWIRAVHLKDVVVEEELVLHVAETVPGRGNLDLPGFLRACNATCPGAWVILEHLGLEDMPSALAAVRAAAGAAGIELGAT